MNVLRLRCLRFLREREKDYLFDLCAEDVEHLAVTNDIEHTVDHDLGALSLVRGNVLETFLRIFVHNEYDVGNVKWIAILFVELNHPVSGVRQAVAEFVGQQTAHPYDSIATPPPVRSPVAAGFPF